MGNECDGCKYKDECEALPDCIVDAYEKGRKDEHESLTKAFFSLYRGKDAWTRIELVARNWREQ